MKLKILKYIQEKTSVFNIESNKEEFTATYIASLFNIKRNTVSHYMNSFFLDNLIIRINTRPVYFLHKESFEIKYFKVTKNSFDSFEELLEVKNTKIIDNKPFEKFLGVHNSLDGIVEKVKTSVFYPIINKMPIIISGETGVGKSFLAEIIYEYCIVNKIIKNESKFIIFNCAQYANNPELLSSNLFGHVKGAFTGADKNFKGILEEAEGGIVFLDEVHRLSKESQEKLFVFMDKGIIQKIGDASNEKKVNVRLLFATTELESDLFLKTFLRRIPIKLELPSLNERSNFDVLTLIENFIRTEANYLNKNIVIPERVLEFLLHFEYKGNIGELKNTIKYMCGKAYTQDLNASKIFVTDMDLPDDKMLTHIKLYKINFSNKYREYSSIDIPVINNKNIKTKKFEVLFKNIKDCNLSKIENTLDLIENELNNYENNCMLYKAIFSVVAKILKDKIFEYKVKFNEETINKLTYFINEISRKKFQDIGIIKKKSGSLYQNKFKDEMNLSEIILKSLSIFKGNDFSESEKIALALYINYLNMIENSKNIKAIIVAHGPSTACSISETANTLLGVRIFEYFDMPMKCKTIDIINKISNFLKLREIEDGLVILVDMGSLNHIYTEITSVVNVPVVLINNVSTNLALSVGELIEAKYPIEEIIERVKKYNKTKYKIIYPKIKKKNAILISCITGLGTAYHLRNMLKKSMASDFNMEIIPVEYSLFKNMKKLNEIKITYDVRGVITTMDLPKIEFLSVTLDEIVNDKGNEKLFEIFKELCSVEEVELINNNFIKIFSLESVVSSVTILDTQKVIENINFCLTKFERISNMKIPNNKKIILYIHISCLIERLVRNLQIDRYNNCIKKIQCQRKMINFIKESFSGIEEMYNVKINDEEVWYVHDILTGNLDNNEEIEF
ncbi:MAG: sigma 54-interacting transcriptional regulator [Sarcina sp.]